ncbi:helix-turn-helix transcriptional regulator [Faecalibacterium sp. I3-3-33]|uniref:XRE family transcriptional regulator n=1 Tax=Faecalibacterium prausnitzii TaxID=853 RepID=A0AAX1QJ58_9FIRM|nr:MULTISPECIES: helix-turn-helix transcriptional regulator [Faecalibacterium]AXA81432.1 XRE family transcriptional regulator [Faecalibacterium prausnitzii]RAW50879.1 XRE family transcriptional regulator [Faecalibacterium prausnitzii]UQK46612.1 helix-turn-helix transcriptional regulator [Faecalibacterium sp. I3-3-33]
MAVTYKRLFHLMIDRNISNTELISKAGVSANIFTRMKRNQYIALDSIEKICSVLDCQVDDILEFTSDGSDDQSKGDVKDE